jgi:short-subunit dehydrogenase
MPYSSENQVYALSCLTKANWLVIAGPMNRNTPAASTHKKSRQGSTLSQPPWSIGPHEDRIRASAGLGHPWPNAQRTDAIHGSAERRPPWRFGSHKDGLHAGANQSPPWDIALITGASSGIGEALARNLAARGVHVILAARRMAELRRIAMEIRSSGGVATAVKLDVSKTDELAEKLTALDKKFGGIDLVIANAGVGVRTEAPPAPRSPQASLPFGVRTDAPPAQRTAQASVPSWSWQAVEPVLQTNFMGAIATITALLPAMSARGRGHVVAISSLASYGALPDASGYVSPKAGLSRFMECLTLDLQGTGITTSTVHVGFVATPMVAKSTIPLPFIMPADQAAARIVQGLIKKKREINFPWLMVVLVRALALLPFSLKAYVARRYYKQERDSQISRAT